MQVPGFTDHVGPTRQLPRDATPFPFFLLLFTTELIDLIVKYTNSNAVEMILSDAAGNVEGTLAWTPTSSAEIMAFLEIVILMGIVKLPSTQLYWCIGRGTKDFISAGLQKYFLEIASTSF